MNRLAREASPYLLQHAGNPVDWHPWGAEAFEKAEREDKPLFLSIGYSTCHWCHVMERESFEDEGVAAVLNKHFVPVKVDREERPDVDKIYMAAATAVGLGGGWPLNLWLTPELKPFYGGTYFPPRAKWGRPGLAELAERIGELWRTDREKLVGDAARVAEALEQATRVEGRAGKLDEGLLHKGFAALRLAYDKGRGGFGGAPKFPMPVYLNVLLWYRARTGSDEALSMALTSLREMAKGGIYDHVGGGFHRYSVDGEWRVPHFEKMLYDNAQLASNYLQAYQLSGDKELARVARETLEYLRRDMTHPEGGLFSAEDADSVPPGKAADAEKSEGAFYLWTEKELREALGKKADGVIARFGVLPDGNALEDPHGDFAGKNILYVDKPVDVDAKALKTLLALRAKRPRPHLDDKVLTSWNGLAISAYARGWQALGDKDLLESAQRAARFLRGNLYDAKARRLYHVWRGGKRAVPGMADDYAFLAQALLDLFESDFDPAWLEWALELTETQNELFLDEAGGLFMTAKDHDGRLLVRVKEDSDNVEPSASSVAALNMLRLAQLAGRDDLRRLAVKTLESFGAQLAQAPRSLPQMLIAADFALAKPRQIVVAGKTDDPRTQKLLRAVWARFLPAKVLIAAEEGAPILKGLKPKRGAPTAFVCVDFACELPVTDLAALEKTLDAEAAKS